MPAVQSQVAKVGYPALLDEAWQQHLAPRADDAPAVISTFAGCGGSSLGYSMAGFRELLAVEWDNNAVETFKLNFPGVPVYHGDIAKLSVEKCRELTGVKPGELDVLDGSPPCQGFSTAGKRNMDDDRNQLFREFVRLLRGLKPRAFVMENVSGMVKGKMKLVFAECLRELKASGYRVSARLMNAMYFHVPQSRQRLIFVGVRADLDAEPGHPRAESRVVSVVGAAPGEQGKRFVTFRNTGGGLGNESSPASRPSPAIMKSGLEYYCKPPRQLVPVPVLCTCQSIPAQWQWPIASDDVKRKRIGNSVPPLFMRAIAQHIRQEILAGK